MIKKISTKELRPGMTVARMQSDIWCHCPHLYTKVGVVATAAEVQAIIDAGFTEVFIDVAQTSPADLSDVAHAAAPAAAPSRVVFSEELSKARELYAQALLVVRDLFAAASRGRAMDMAAATGAVDSLHDSLSRNPGALGCLARLADADAYLHTHSVNVAVLTMLVGRAWGCDRETVRDLGLAGLFHDLGKTRLPIGLLNRRTTLSPGESKTMEGHCVHGLAILEGQRDVSRTVKRAVVEHHERFDGKGYPFGLSHEQISLPGRLLSLADCFDALVSRRTYKAAMPPSKALSIMFGMRGADFDAGEVDRFIKVLSVYPAGSVVKLSTGEVAVVCEVNPGAPLAPLVAVVLNASLNPMTPILRDLAAGDEGDPERCNIETFLDGDALEHDPLALLPA